MERIVSELPKNAYIALLRQKFDSPFRLFSERVTGVVVGSCFSIAHYAEFEWNRKITSECNRAWGIVREKDGKTEVCFIRGKGLMSPFWLILFFLIFLGALYFGMEEMTAAVCWLSAGLSLMIGGLTAFESTITENGVNGAGEITRLLKDPEDFYV